MMTYFQNSNVRQLPLTIDQVRNYAPSAFALAAHESRSDKYQYIPTVNIIEGMIKAGFQPFKAQQSRCRIAGKQEFTKHMIRFRQEGRNESLVVGDHVPEIVLINSHDGTSAYKLMAGIYRLVCMNGLVVAESTIASISIPHKGDIISRVIDGSSQVLQDSTRVLGRLDDWQRLQLTAGEQQAFSEAAHTLRFGDSEGETDTPITAAQLLQPRRSEDQGADLWHTFNRVQENAIKGGLRGTKRDERGRRVRRVSTREVRGIDQDVKLNRALWQLAERMAELKAA
jgi:hypothetical protein